ARHWPAAIDAEVAVVAAGLGSSDATGLAAVGGAFAGVWSGTAGLRTTWRTGFALISTSCTRRVVCPIVPDCFITRTFCSPRAAQSTRISDHRHVRGATNVTVNSCEPSSDVCE